MVPATVDTNEQYRSRSVEVEAMMVVDVKRSKQVDEQEVKRRAAECGTYRQGMPRLRPTMSSATFGVLRLAFISPAVLYQKDIDYSTIRPPENPPKIILASYPRHHEIPPRHSHPCRVGRHSFRGRHPEGCHSQLSSGCTGFDHERSYGCD